MSDHDPFASADETFDSIPGLDRLAATVDPDLAGRAFHRVRVRRARQRRILAGGVVVLVMVVGLGALASAMSQGDGPGRRVRTGQPATTTTETTAPRGVRYWARAEVEEDVGQGPSLCLGPQVDFGCGGAVRVTNWDWSKVEGELRSAGRIIGGYDVIGTYDRAANTFTLTETPKFSPRPDPADKPALVDPPDFFSGDLQFDYPTPCPEPAGGWVAADPKVWNDEAYSHFSNAVRVLPDFAGISYDHRGHPAQERTYGVHTIAFTKDLARHEAEVRALWGGPVCVVKSGHSAAELRTIERSLQARRKELGIMMSFVDEHTAVVRVSVIAIDDDLVRLLDARYGPGTVEMTPYLRRLAK
jgi:hypothetical protein